jgi:rare lipoprotein A (peptidoglycan hydrolase)
MKISKLLYPAFKTGLLVFIFVSGSNASMAQADTVKKSNPSTYSKGKRIFYGQASYYANKFHGRKTASGEIFSQ